MSEIIHASAAPLPVGRYPHARRVGNLLFLSGIGPRTPSVQEILTPAPAMDHSGHGGMDHSQHQGMDHGKAKPAEAEDHEGMDHSKHQGMDHGPPAAADDASGEDTEQDDGSDEHDHHHHGATP